MRGCQIGEFPGNRTEFIGDADDYDAAYYELRHRLGTLSPLGGMGQDDWSNEDARRHFEKAMAPRCWWCDELVPGDNSKLESDVQCEDCVTSQEDCKIGGDS